MNITLPTKKQIRDRFESNQLTNFRGEHHCTNCNRELVVGKRVRILAAVVLPSLADKVERSNPHWNIQGKYCEKHHESAERTLNTRLREYDDLYMNTDHVIVEGNWTEDPDYGKVVSDVEVVRRERPENDEWN